MFRNIACGAVFVFALISSANAATVTYFFTADRSFSRGDPDALAGVDFADTITGSFSFDAAVVPSSVLNLTGGDTAQYALTSFDVDFGPVTFASSMSILTVANATTRDRIIVQDLGNGTVGSAPINDLRLSYDGLVDAWDDITIPLISELQNPASSASAFVDLDLRDPFATTLVRNTVRYDNLQFSATSFANTNTVPLPASSVLLFAACGVFAGVRRFKKS